MIAVVDYGAGNLTSVRKALAAVGADAFTPAGPGDILRARGIIVPGVGHFAATRPLDEAWRRALLAALAAGRPLLGICVGLQWLFEGSAEQPDLPGLGLFPGQCTRLPESRAEWRGQTPSVVAGKEQGSVPFSVGGRGVDARTGVNPNEVAVSALNSAGEGSVPLKVPHVGWNSLSFPCQSRLFGGVREGAQVYFTHSYAAPIVEDTVAVCDYGVPFSAAVERGILAAVQFHPEKSGDVGLQVLRNWIATVAN